MPFSKREVLSFLFKDLRKTLIVSGAIAGVAVLAALIVSPKYTSTSTLLVLLAPEYGYRPDPGSGALVNVEVDRDSILNTEIKILTSSAVEREAIEKVGVATLYPDLAREPGLFGTLIDKGRGALGSLGILQPPRQVQPIELALDKLQRALNVVPDKAANIISVSLSNPDPDVAADGVNALVAVYLDKRHQIFTDIQSSLLQSQSDVLSRQLDAVSQEYASSEINNSTADYDRQLDEYVKQKADLETSLRSAEADIAQSAKLVSETATQIASTSPTVVQYVDNDADRRLEALRVKLADAEAHTAGLTQQYSDQSPILREALQETRNIQSEIDRTNAHSPPSTVRTARSAVLETLTLDHVHAQNDLKAGQARVVELQKQLDAMNDQISQFTAKKGKLDELGRRKNLVEANYNTVMKALGDRRLVENIDAHRAANVRIVQSGEPPLSSTPLRLVIIAAGIFLSAISGIGTALFSYAFRRGYYTPEDLERGLGVPTLASLPLITIAPHKPRWGFPFSQKQEQLGGSEVSFEYPAPL